MFRVSPRMCEDAVTDLIRENTPSEKASPGSGRPGSPASLSHLCSLRRASSFSHSFLICGTGVALQGVVTCQASVMNGSPTPSQGLDAQSWVCLLRTERWVGPKPEHRPGELPKLAPCPQEVVMHLYPPPFEPLSLLLL